MKKVLQYLVVLSTSAILLVAAMTVSAMAESRGKALRRAADEIRKTNYDEAEKIYRSLLEKDKTDKEARLGLSFTLIKEIKLQEAYEDAAQVITADPLNSRAFALLGTSLLRSGEFRNSIEALYTAVKFNNKEALAIAGLSEIEYYEHRIRNAYDGLKRAIAIDPLESDYYLSLARACSRLEYYGEAADAYQRFLDVTPKTDIERRDRIRGLIDFYHYLGATKIHRTSGKEITSVPIELVNHRPYITVMVNGTPLRFVVDTGSSLSVISEKIAGQIGVKAVARGGNARAVGGSGTFPIVYGLLDSLTIGDAKIEEIPVYIRTIHSVSDTPDNEKSDGYIGLSVLSNYAVTIDYHTRRLTLDRTPLHEDPAKAADANPSTQPPITGDIVNGFEIPIRSTSGGLASAETHLPKLDRPLNFIIDTGATTTVISKAVVQRNDLEGLKLKGETIRVIGAAGVEEGVEMIGLSSLTVNGLRKNNSRAVILNLDAVNESSGFEQHGILGGDYLENFRIEIDLRRFLFKLTPENNAISVAKQ